MRSAPENARLRGGASSPAAARAAAPDFYPRARRASLPLERRRPLLDECADALARILGLEADVLSERLELERLAQVTFEVVVDRALREANRDGRTRGDLAPERIGRR